MIATKTLLSTSIYTILDCVLYQRFTITYLPLSLFFTLPSPMLSDKLPPLSSVHAPQTRLSISQPKHPPRPLYDPWFTRHSAPQPYTLSISSDRPDGPDVLNTPHSRTPHLALSAAAVDSYHQTAGLEWSVFPGDGRIGRRARWRRIGYFGEFGLELNVGFSCQRDQ
jgi:hypothetical protein